MNYYLLKWDGFAERITPDIEAIILGMHAFEKTILN